jgi:hypothetical protein
MGRERPLSFTLLERLHMISRTLTRSAVGVLVGLALAAALPAARADIVLNQEPNNTFATAQVIPASAFTQEFNPYIVVSGPSGGYVNSSLITPHATILRPGTDEFTSNLDYFRFHTAGGPIVADIDSTPVATNFDTKIYLFNADGLLLATNDNVGLPTDPGDGPGLIGGLLNSRIETGMLPAGDYLLAVSQAPSFGFNGGDVVGSPFGGGPIPFQGSYTLNLSIETPEPSTLAMLGLGIAGLVVCRTWRRRQRA